MKLYLDVCWLNRLTDDQSQERIRLEAQAVEELLRRLRRGEWRLLTSEVIEDEVDRSPFFERRLEALAILSMAAERIAIGADEVQRARLLRGQGYGAFDALHLAAAEALGADALLTTDDRFLKLYGRQSGNPRIPVMNPLLWIKEHMR